MKFSSVVSGTASVALLCMSTMAATPPQDRSHTGLQLGDVLPEIESTGPLSLLSEGTEAEPHYTLVHFWASYDAPSRVLNREWSQLLAGNSSHVSYRAISLDPDETVYSHTIKLDGIEQTPEQQNLSIEYLRQQAYDSYGLRDSMHSYLVNERGVVVGVDPSYQEVQRLIQL